MKRYFWDFGISASSISIVINIISLSMGVLFTQELLSRSFNLIAVIYIFAIFINLLLSIVTVILLSLIKKPKIVLIASKLLLAVIILWILIYIYTLIFIISLNAAALINFCLSFMIVIIIVFSILFIDNSFKHKGLVLIKNSYDKLYKFINYRIQTAYKFMIVGVVFGSFFIIPLAWLIPMTLKTKKLIHVYNESISLGICCIVFGTIFNFIAGIYILLNKPSDYIATSNNKINNKNNINNNNNNKNIEGLNYINIFEN